jgi:serine/threonine protein kinase
VRLFLGEFTGGTIGAKLRSRGLDTLVWIKEYSGTEALALAKSEKIGLGLLQSSWLKQTLQQRGNKKDELVLQMQKGEWINMASRRYVDGITNTPTRIDDENVISLLEYTFNQRAQFTCLLGELNLNDYYDDDPNPNEWYKSLGVKPPIPGSVWLVFDYHGLSTAASYSVPHVIQRSKLPPKRGIFGGIVEPPSLPPFTERAKYVIQGVLKGMLTALATAHNANIIHRSIGRNSFILSSIGQDKREATSPYATVLSRLRVILSDWGFSALAMDAIREKEFSIRLRMFDLPNNQGDNSIMNDQSTTTVAIDFAKAEDLNALGFVFLGLLFTTLAEPATLTAPMPATDDDTWQRLFTDIFDKDMEQFRDYCANEDVWDSVVGLLDKENGAGWDLLGSLLLSRERLRDWYTKDEERSGTVDVISASSLASHPFFKVI